MTLTLRALLIIVSILATTGVIGRIRKAKMQIEDAVFWVLFSFLLILLAVVPRILYFFTELLGMQSPANLLFLVIIGLLLMKVFSMSIKMSLLEEKLKTLAQNEALEKLERNEASEKLEWNDASEKQERNETPEMPEPNAKLEVPREL